MARVLGAGFVDFYLMVDYLPIPYGWGSMLNIFLSFAVQTSLLQYLAAVLLENFDTLGRYEPDTSLDDISAYSMAGNTASRLCDLVASPAVSRQS